MNSQEFTIRRDHVMPSPYRSAARVASKVSLRRKPKKGEHFWRVPVEVSGEVMWFDVHASSRKKAHDKAMAAAVRQLGASFHSPHPSHVEMSHHHESWA